jgi:hypothetical protein
MFLPGGNNQGLFLKRPPHRLRGCAQEEHPLQQMGYPLDSKEWLSLLDLDNLLAHRTREFPPAPRDPDLIP